ncbi:MAG: methylenetetrahydrofolate reductase [Oscillospiraceae bacterium]|nr:methylenetetrahydrofolate reductase [Oscillospiraceae bacterium]
MSDNKSNLQKILEAGHFSVTSEIGPPMSANADFVREQAHDITGLVDAANVTDCQAAVVRMSSVAASVLALQEGVEPILQMTCRDRNRIAIQSDLLGASALGIKNLLILSGDHQSVGNHPQSKNVFDVDSIQLLKAMNDHMENGVFIGGSVSKVPAQFFLGSTTNPFADPEEMQLIRLEKKINAGAKFIQTQAIYNIERFNTWMEKVRERGLHERTYILAGIVVNKSQKSIEITATVPGMDIPEVLLERMRNTENKQAEGLAIALELIKDIRKIEGIKGLHIMAIGWDEIVPVLLEKAGFLPRPVL